MSLEPLFRNQQALVKTTLTSEIAMPAYNHLTSGQTYAERFGIPRDDAGSVDRTAAIQYAIDNSVGKLIFPPGLFRVSSAALTLALRHGLCIEGQGAFDSGEGTCFVIDKADCTLFDLKGCYELQLKNFMVKGAQVPTSGATIKLDKDASAAPGVSSSVFSNIRIEDCYNGIQTLTCNNINIDTLQIRKCYGDYGVKFSGTSASVRSDVMNISRYVGDIGVGGSSYVNRGARATSTAYAVGDIATANSNIYICKTAGTSSSGAAPSGKGIIGNRDVTDGTVTWSYICTTSFAWFWQDNYAYTCSVEHARLINGCYGVRMSDTAASGTSFPTWLRGRDLDCDHSIFAGVFAERGEDLEFDDLWISSTLAGSGFNLGANHKGGLKMVNSEVNFSAQHGIVLDSGPTNNMIMSTQIGHNSIQTANTYDGIATGSTASSFTIIGNQFDARPTSISNSQRWGVAINAATNNRYVILGNRGQSNSTGLISDTTNNSTRYVAGNL